MQFYPGYYTQNTVGVDGCFGLASWSGPGYIDELLLLLAGGFATDGKARIITSLRVSWSIIRSNFKVI